MNPISEGRAESILPDRSMDVIRTLVNIAQTECVCQLHLSVCLLTDTGERAGIQPFLYDTGLAA